MLDIKKIIENKQIYIEGLSNRGYDVSNLDIVISLNENRGKLITDGDKKRAQRNEISKKIGNEKRKPTEEETNFIKSLAEDLKNIDIELNEINEKIKSIMLEIPNLPHETVPVGIDDSKNVEIDIRGQQKNEDFIIPHWDIGPEKEILDLEAGANISGARFFVLKDKGARLHRALMNWMMDVHTDEFGYSEIDPPYLVKQDTMIGSGNLPKFKDNLYRDEETDLWLIPTAEVSLNALHQGKIIAPDQLPLSYVARTPSFRKEHTSAGRDIRGIKRVHQFFKVEMFKFVEPENSMDHLEKMVENARTLCDRLGLSSKLIQLSTGDIGFQSGITFDIEVWAAGSKEWLEVSSISNCFDFQTRRNNTRYKSNQSSPTSFPHTLNGSGLALPRIWVAIIENGQKADGSIEIPEVLVPYTGFEYI
ncbi:MAG: serine--tRNA ligase [Chloroflexota bacterium]|nr:serine--tRNA ligase [Chloroflexota bacterium]MQG19626.1 serine--tRNA ligase [SAR202 cluster bacterium]MEC9098472.1 serine--tRNA ligase [Chloroflexota bacterium]MED5237118.1 serine--tRNA ligase [Chloroflexota bacterium]MED5254575.1 serine--tRNA ligase [Chloroflexota bacterium]|tara:strand:+ start:14319 stop:15578 length:1260 start_codon:yes stop_codon:yes gene_type:complete